MSPLPSLLANGRLADAVLVAVAGGGVAAGAGLAAFATRDIFGDLHHGTPLSLTALALLLAGGAMVAAMRVIGRTLAERLGQTFAIAVRRTLYRHLAGMSSSEVAERRAGALGLRFVGDLAAARNWISLGLTRILSAAVVLPGAGLALYLLNPTLGLAAALPIAGAVLAMLSLAVLLGPLHRGLRKRRANIAIGMMERVAVAPQLDLIGRTGKELQALDRDGAALRDDAVQRIRVASCLRAIPEIGTALAGAAILWVTSRHGLPAADAAGALAVLGILALPLRELAGVWDRRCAWSIARAKIEAVLAKPSARRRPVRAGAPAIVFDRVTFRQLTIDLRVQAGETVLVDGPPSSGKSSVLALAAGLDVPERGEVICGDGERIPKTIFVGEDTPLLQGSLRRALTLGCSPRPDDRTIAAAADGFGLDALIARFGGLGGRVGEGGRNLSASERWRVHLTRALLSEPDLLIIDGPPVHDDPDLPGFCRKLLLATDATTIMAVSGRMFDDLADRRLTIADGRVRGERTSHEPASRTTAEALSAHA